MTTDNASTDAPSVASVAEAVQCVQGGGVVAYPTEAVFGLGCDPNNLSALLRLVALKERAVSKGFILVASEFKQLQPYIAELSDTEHDTVMSTWPGPVTWVVPAAPNTSKFLTGGRDTIAVRISAHPVVHALCEALDSALVSTSANVSGEESITNPDNLVQHLNGGIDMLVDGKLGDDSSVTSIFELATGAKLR